MPYELCDICFVRFPNPTKIFQQLCDDCDQDIKESLGQVIGNISSDYKKPRWVNRNKTYFNYLERSFNDYIN